VRKGKGRVGHRVTYECTAAASPALWTCALEHIPRTLQGYKDDMDAEKRLGFLRLYNETRDAADALHAHTEEVYGMAKNLEELTEVTLVRHAGLQAAGFLCALKELGKGKEQMGLWREAETRGE
jgi:hypothetical protein